MITKFKHAPKQMSLIETLIYLTIAALVLSLSTRFFVNIAGTFTPGIAGVAQGITYTLWNVFSNNTQTAFGLSYSQFVNNIYLLINWSLNIPIIIFSFSKLGKKFSYYSLYVMFSTLIISLLLTNLPGVKEIFDGSQLQELKNSDQQYSKMLEYSIFALIGLFAGFTYGFACGLVFRTGYSTMGFDPVAKYLEIYKAKNINFTLFLFTMISSTIWIFICALTSGDINSIQTLITETILSPTMSTTIIFIFTYGIVSNITYPSEQKSSIEIISEKQKEISQMIIEDENIEGHSLRSLVSGYNNNQVYSIYIITKRENVYYIIDKVKSKDKDSIITVHKLDKAILKIRVN